MIRWIDFFGIAWEALLNWWGDWWNQALMNLIWLASIVTIIFAPTAVFAMTQQNKRVAEGGTASPSKMIRAYPSLFLVSWAWLLSNLVIYVLLIIAFRFYGQTNTMVGLMALIIVTIIGALWLVLQFYTIPVFMWQEEPSLRLAWQNAFALTVHTPLFSIIFLIVTVGVLIISIASGLFLFLGGISLASVLGCQVVYRRLLALNLDEEE